MANTEYKLALNVAKPDAKLAFFIASAALAYDRVNELGMHFPQMLVTGPNSSYTEEGAISHALAELSAMVAPSR